MNDKEIKNEVNQSKEVEQEMLHDIEEIDKLYSQNIIIELIFFLIVIVFLLIFLFGL